jgi:hypothetical protein
VLEQLFWRQIARLVAVEDRLGDVRGEIAEADEPREIGRADAFPFDQCCKGHAVATYKHGIESPRPDQQSNQPRIGFRCGKWIAPIGTYGGEFARETDCLLEGNEFELSVPPPR